MRRVVVLGMSGAGKTTLARELAQQLNVPHIELDAIHWKPNWTSTPTPRLIEEVRAALEAAGDGWTACGHYGQVRDVLWPRADTTIFLDYSMRVVFTRVFARTMLRWWRGEVLWNGNRERLWTQFFHRDSILLWVINMWRIRRRDIPKKLRDPRFAQARLLHFRSPQQLERWKRSLMPGGSRSP
jgi:adenylate kinase family enzyme